MLTEQDGSTTPQSRMTPDEFQAITDYLGITHERGQEALQVERLIRLYFNRNPAGLKLLEIGSGLCGIATHLAEMVGNNNYTGIEANKLFHRLSLETHPHLSVIEGNFLELEVNEGTFFDVVCAPFALINFFPFDIQKKFLEKMKLHGRLAIVHTTLPDVFGIHESVERGLGPEEFGIDYHLTGYFMCIRELLEAVRSIRARYVHCTTYDAMSIHGVSRHSLFAYGA